MILSFAVCFFIQPKSALSSLEPSRKATAVENFSLLDQFGNSHELYRYRHQKAVILFWHGNGCPIVRLSLPKMTELKEKFEKQGFVFLMINAFPQDDMASIQQEARECNITIPILKDDTQFVTKSLGVSRTAETLIIDPRSWSVIYKGPIDDRLDYEVQKIKAKNNFLEEALVRFLNQKQIESKPAEIKGCLIHFENNKTVLENDSAYSKIIAPILIKKCASCHFEGGIAPWTMTNHKKVRGWAPMMREVILTKRMPPWQADPQFGKFVNDLSLTAEERTSLLEWIENGAPRGTGPDPLEKIKKSSPSAWELGEPDLIVSIPEQEIPATGIVQYRKIVSDFVPDRNLWIRAAQILPGNTKITHHINISSLLKETNESYDNKVSENYDYVGLYAPGLPVLAYPENTAKRILKGSRLIFQIHYTPIGVPLKDKPLLGLYFHPHPSSVKQLFTTCSNSRNINIPPRVSNYKKSRNISFRKNIWLYELFPHMHYRGRSGRFTAKYPDGTEEILLSVPNYNFNWQHLYRFESPKFLPAGTVIKTDAVYDNSAENPLNPEPDKWVRYGEQGFEEMMLFCATFVEAEDKKQK